MRVSLTTEMTDAFEDWFLLRSRCRLEHREPNLRGSDLEERRWAHWINSARYSSSIRAVEISIRLDWILLFCGCVRRTVKRFFPEDPSWPALVEELTRRSEGRQRGARLVDDGLVTTATDDFCVKRFRSQRADVPGRCALTTPYDHLPPQYRKMYDSVRPVVKAVSESSQCYARSGSRKQCHCPPGSGTTLRACQDVGCSFVLASMWADDPHRCVMMEVHRRLCRIWKAWVGAL